jgi:hypothetical protein
MNLSSRLVRLESGLPAKTAALRWLHEAREYESLGEYMEWLGSQPKRGYPLNRVPREACAGAAAANKGRAADAIAEAKHVAAREAYCLVELILQINIETVQLLRLERLRAIAVSALLATVERDAELATYDPVGHGGRHQDQWSIYLEAAGAQLADLYVAQDARVILEQRYLDGHECLLGELGEEFDELLREVEYVSALWYSVSLPGYEGAQKIEADILDMGALRASCQDRAEVEAARYLKEARSDADRAMGGKHTLWRDMGPIWRP